MNKVENLKFRREFKFALYGPQISKALQFLQPQCHPDPTPESDDGWYEVHSVYFDSFGMRTFHEKLAGLPERSRFRLRRYDEFPDGFLEKKIRSGEKTAKLRTEVNAQDWSHLLAGNHISLNRHSPLFSELLGTPLCPTIEISYSRSAFFIPGENRVRVTVDRDLRVRSVDRCFQKHKWHHLNPQSFGIFEVKTVNRIPNWISEIVSRLNLSIESVSKYVMAVRYLHELHVLREDMPLAYM